MNEIVANFQRQNWGDIRTRIDAMILGDTEKFKLIDKYSVTTSAARTRYAYGDRRFSMMCWQSIIFCTRIE